MTHPLWSRAQQVSLGISPPLLELMVKPGKSLLIAYTLENYGDPTIISSYVLPFEAVGSFGNVRIKNEFEGPIRFSLENSDIQLEQPFFLKNKGMQQLLLRMRVPEGAPEGDYYYTFLHETQPAPLTEGISSSRAKASIGAHLLITVTSTGQTEIKARVAQFDTVVNGISALFGKKLRLYDSTEKIPVVLHIENLGKNVVRAEGEIVLKGNFGEKANYTVLPQNVLSMSSRIVPASPSAELSTSKPASLVLSGFFLGSYQLSATVNFGEGSPTLYASTSFVALPFKFSLIALVAIIIAYFVVSRVKNDE